MLIIFTCGVNNVSASAGTPVVPAAGDANCDGVVNSIDAALILQYVAALASSLSCQDAADANGSGAINSIDAFLVLQYNAGLIDDLRLPDAYAEAQQIEEDPAPDLPGDYVNLPQAFAVDGTLAHYGASDGPNTNAHVTHDVDYSAEGYPPAGGAHWGATACGTDPTNAPAFCAPVPWGIYRDSWSPESLVHNMEHGGVVVWYNTSDTSVRDQIEAEATRYLKNGYFIVVALYTNMPQDTIALTAWARREELSTAGFSASEMDAFIEAFNCRFNPERLFCHSSARQYEAAPTRVGTALRCALSL